jgi:hypothetical protein
MMNARKRGEGKTPHRTLRVEDDLWDAFSEAAQQQGSDRTAVLRGFMEWYARRPGAKMPKRPEEPTP